MKPIEDSELVGVMPFVLAFMERYEKHGTI